MHIKFFGNNALTEFKKLKTLKDLQGISNKIEDINVIHLHYITLKEHKEILTEKELIIVRNLLKYGKSSNSKNYEKHNLMFIITPRIGTISPWSSKATDIFLSCNLSKISKVERGIIYYIKTSTNKLNSEEILKIRNYLYDKMTESIYSSLKEFEKSFHIEYKKKSVESINILKKGKNELIKANIKMNLSLSNQEINYLFNSFSEINKNPTDVELMMFAQANSEHCRHKIFNAKFIIDNKKQRKSLFEMIKNTYKNYSEGLLSAYNDNASVVEGFETQVLIQDNKNKYTFVNKTNNMQIKVETHNHPTAISPFSGSLTGAGGEIRDESATGRGAKPKAGMTGFIVSNLDIPNFKQDYNFYYGKPDRIASPLKIMLDAPIGGAAFNNEFGRPNLCGFFRTFEQKVNNEVRGFHKPIMMAGGYGNIISENVKKNIIPNGAKLIVLGGPSMLIGLGGGSSSSVSSGKNSQDLDFSSVQRGNPEMQRKAQAVIDKCSFLNENPIISIHDVGAGGISNALPELVSDSNMGAIFDLEKILVAEKHMSPLEIWCNESQERYVLAILEKDLELFKNIAQRENCPFCVVGEATNEKSLILKDKNSKINPIDIPLQVLLGKVPKITKNVFDENLIPRKFNYKNLNIYEVAHRVLTHPTVSDKSFLITIGDRTVGGMTARDQMIGPWQIPISNVAVTTNSFTSYRGEAMAVGERPQLSLISPEAAARMAVGEAITNILAADIEYLSDIKLSANWMASSGSSGEDAILYKMVKELGENFCPKLDLTIPVGKDSLSMKTSWQDTTTKENKEVTSPVSLIITAFSQVEDVRKTKKPRLHIDRETDLVFIDLGRNRNRLGGSVFAQCYQEIGARTPDINYKLLNRFFISINILNQKGKILSYHDRSDGGLFTTLCEMMFASKCGLEIHLYDFLEDNHLKSLFNEELGVVIQINHSDKDLVLNQFHALNINAFILGNISKDDNLTVYDSDNKVIYQNTRKTLHRLWSKLSYHMQELRDNPKCAKMAYDNILNDNDAGLFAGVSFDFTENIHSKFLNVEKKPKVAILREQGVNSHFEMSAAFNLCGFDAFDVTMYDLKNKKVSLKDFNGLAICGGFSYGDVLGAGGGWAKSILYNPHLKNEFIKFFAREDTFSLGICNGCQMLSQLKSLIPNAQHFPKFIENESSQFEARLSMVKIEKNPSLFFKDMEGSFLPIAVSHAEGKIFIDDETNTKDIYNNCALKYVDNNKNITEVYPYNPNGSKDGLTGFSSSDGKVLIMMPHPERVFRNVQLSWHPRNWDDIEFSPWFRMFVNARIWVDKFLKN